MYTEWDDGSFTWEPTESFIDDKGSQTNCYRVFIKAEKKKEEEKERKLKREAIEKRDKERKRRWEEMERKVVGVVQEKEMRKLQREEEEREKAETKECSVVLIHARYGVTKHFFFCVF